MNKIWNRLIQAVVVIFFSFFCKATTLSTNHPIKVILFPTVARVDSLETWKLTIILNDQMNTGGGIKCRFVKGFSPIQFLNSNLEGFVATSCSNPNSQVKITKITQDDVALNWDVDNNGWLLSCIVLNSSLSTGDSIFINFGASNNGKMKSPTSAFSDSILVAYDVIGNGVYKNFSPSPVISTVSSTPQTLRAYIPSISFISNYVKLKINIIDGKENLTNITGQMNIECSDSNAEFPNSVIFTPSDSGHKIINVKFNTKGVHFFTIKLNKNPVSSWTIKSNYSKVVDISDSVKIYWGDIHCHSNSSRDGMGTGAFRKASIESGLDFFSLTDHTEGYSVNTLKGGINPKEWKALKEDVKNFHIPGEFVTILGYEFTAESPSGHHNVYFNIDDSLIDNVPIYRTDINNNIRDVWNLKSNNYPQISFITIPHHSGIKWSSFGGPEVTFGTIYRNDKIRPSLEIYSSHGESEYYNPSHPLSYENISSNKHFSASGPHYAQDAWISGEFLGVVASSDDHSATPGLPFKGLTAVISKELTRNSIFEAIHKRHTYGTTGQRIILDFKINGELMGSRLKLDEGQLPAISVDVTGTDTLSLIEILKWSLNQIKFGILFSTNPNTVSFSYNFTDSAFDQTGIYYLRIKQKNFLNKREVWAWSSPIWINLNVVDSSSIIPTNNIILDVFQNPTYSVLKIGYSLFEDDRIELCIFNIFGQKIKTISSGYKLKGYTIEHSDISTFPVGMYFVKLKVERMNTGIIKKIIKM